MLAENMLSFEYDFHLRDLRPTTLRIAELIEFRGFDHLTLSFEQTSRAFADAMLPLVALALKYREEGVAFTIVPPVNPKLRRIMLKSGWLNYFDPRYPEAEPEESDLNLPAYRFANPDTQTFAVDRLLDRILRLVSRLERNHLRALEWALNEITDNVLTHSESEFGGLIQLVLKPHSQEIQFVVADAGIGIPNSLRRGLSLSYSDEEALEQAVMEGVTSGVGQGNGLYGTIRIAAVSGGAFSINSGSAFLSISRDRRTVVREESVGCVGTTVDCTISFARPLILENALNFRGKPYTPVDYIDNKYDNEADYLEFTLRDETRSVGSRLSGRLTRQMIMNLLTSTNKTGVAIDSSGIGLMSSSFADELFVKLLLEFREENFGQRVRLIGISEVNAQIIERSRMQRMKNAAFARPAGF